MAVERGRPPAEDRPEADVLQAVEDAHRRSRGLPWLREGSQVAQQQTLRTYAAALDHSFKVTGRRKPVIKRRKDAPPSLEYTVRGFTVRAGRLALPKGVTVPVVWSRDLPSRRPASASTRTASATGTPRSSSPAKLSQAPDADGGSVSTGA